MSFFLKLLITIGFACGVHDPQVLSELYPDKQFPDDHITYSPNNSQHRGWLQYLTKSLYGTRTIALTFDDGPHPTNTLKLLNILDKYHVKATFFEVTELSERFPNISAEVVRRGHVLASHDWRHDNSNSETESEFEQGLEKSLLVIRNIYKKREAYYRFPYGAYARGLGGYHHLNVMKQISQKLFGENCINFAFWDIDTSDWVGDMTPDNIVETLTSNLEGGRAWQFKAITRGGRTVYEKEAYQIDDPTDGGVVLMHDIHSRTIEAVDKFLATSIVKGVKFVTLSEIDEFAYNDLVCQLLP